MCHRNHTASCSHAVTKVLSLLTESALLLLMGRSSYVLGSSLDQSDEMLGADSIVIASSITALYMY